MIVFMKSACIIILFNKTEFLAGFTNLAKGKGRIELLKVAKRRTLFAMVFCRFTGRDHRMPSFIRAHSNNTDKNSHQLAQQSCILLWHHNN